MTGIVVRNDTALDHDLAELVLRDLRAATSPATVRAYRSDWADYQSWCQAHGRSPLPASAETVAAYASQLAEAGRALSTIRRRVGTISKAHKVRDYPSPAAELLVREVLRGLRRRLGVSTHQARPLLPVDVARWLPLLEPGPRTTRDASLITLGLAGGFRRSELAELVVDDVQAHDRGLVVRVRRGKTDQEGRGRLVGIAFGRHDATCPVRRWRDWLAVADERGVDPADPAYLSITSAGTIDVMPITGRTVSRAVKRLVAAGGADPAGYSGHSLRSGFCTAAAQAGARQDAIMRQTGHRSVQVLTGYMRVASLWDDNPSSIIGL